MASTSRQPEVELTNAFAGVASTSGRSAVHEKKLPYDVFINHRGPDVKHTLAATLYNTLTVMGLRVFLDSEELELGDFLPGEIEEAMRGASFHIAIFSQNYAQSPWCLAELSFMLKTGAKIVPVFYYVQPDDVRYAKGVYTDAFSQHNEKGRYSSAKLQEWKNALNNVSYNVGYIINNKDDEGRLLKNIVNCVLKVIKNVPFVVAKHPVGLYEIVIDFETRLQSVESHPTVQIVGIWGMGGSGKTTFAKQLYNNKYKNMERSSFLSDVRDAAYKSVLHIKQKKLIEDLGLRDVSIDSVEEGKGILARRLRSIRVLIVLDDVDTVDQLDALVPNKDSLGCGSLIVVTTREREVLQGWGISFIYKMKALDEPHAKQLFCWHAFLKPSPLPEFEDLVENFLDVCKGLPLSLKVFGAQLYGNSNKDYWKSLLHKISRKLDQNIKEQLELSYDALDDEEKHMFLDCACFFIGEQKSSAIAAWDGSGWSGLHSWEKLLNKCLVELDDYDCIRLHDHLRDLGREIADRKSPYRLWSTQQIINVDNETQGIGIRGILCTTAGSTSEVEFPRCSQGGELMINTSQGERNLTPNLLGLKIFQVRGNNYNQVIGDTSRELVWLRWFNHGQRNLHSLSLLKNLRVLELKEERDHKHLEELWETDSIGPVLLRELVIDGCSKFQGFPKSIGRLIYLKKIVLSYGSKMKSLPESFCLLQSLEHLELYGCKELSSLPSSFGNLRNLRHLNLTNCFKLSVLPDSFKKLTLLQHLSLGFCWKLTSESNLFESMTKLEYLDLGMCKLEEFPRHITNQASLIPANISQLSKLQQFVPESHLLTRLPTTLEDLLSLIALEICAGSRLESLPDSVGRLNNLKELRINGCSSLKSLPDSVRDLNNLKSIEIYDCSSLQSLPDSVGHLNNLKWLKIGNSGLKSLPQSFRQLSNLQELEIVECPINNLDLRAGSITSSSPVELQWYSGQTLGCPISDLDLNCLPRELDLNSEPPLSLCNLKEIVLRQTQVSKISISEDCCPGLETLRLEENDHLTEIEVLPTTIKDLNLSDSGMVRNINGIAGLVNIQTLIIRNCHKLDALPSFAQLASLQLFHLEGCYGVKKIQGLEQCRALEELIADTRWEEAGIETLEEAGMERLRSLHLMAINRSAIEGCIPSMQRWPEVLIVCTRAVPESGSLLDSFDFTNPSVIDSFSNQTLGSCPSLELSSNAHAIMLCFVLNCSHKNGITDEDAYEDGFADEDADEDTDEDGFADEDWETEAIKILADKDEDTYEDGFADEDTDEDGFVDEDTDEDGFADEDWETEAIKILADKDCLTSFKLPIGKWVLICVITQSSRFHRAQKFDIKPELEGEVEVENGLLVGTEEERVAEAFHGLLKLLSN